MGLSLEDKLRQFNANAALASAATIPSSWYLDGDMWELERRAVFGNSWLAAARADQLSQPGSFVTTEVAGEPILLVRDVANDVRGFYNVCRHRAARVATECEGTATRFRCPYHGWTYDLEGRLKGVPEFDGVANFRREDNGLVPMAVNNWGPLTFVHGGKAPPALRDYLQPLAGHASAKLLQGLRFVERRDYTLACNWKIFVDNFLDGGYHVNYIHPSLAGVLDYSGYHTVNEGHTSVQISPMRPPDRPGDNDAAGTVRKGAVAYYWWIFPNLMINIYDEIMDTNLVLPLGPDRCRVVFDFYFAPGTMPSDQFMRQSIAVGDRIQQEDVGICEDVQRGLASRAFDTGRYSVRRESGVHHFHRLLAQQLTMNG